MKAVNLLPNDLKPAAGRPAALKVGPDSQRPLGAYAVLAALALVVVGVVALVLAGNGIKEREAELASAKAEQQSLAAEASRLAAFGEYQTLAANRVQTVRDLAASRFDWEQALRDLSRAIPANVTLAKVTGTVAPGISSGGAASANPLRAAIAKPAVELEGCTVDQRAVATLMARLRSLQGATRVALSKSEREDNDSASGSGTSDSAGPGEKAEGCGAGAPAKFEMVVFFEGATAVAATPGPGAAAAPTTGSGKAAASATPSATPAAGGTAAPASTPGAAKPAAPSSKTNQEVETR